MSNTKNYPALPDSVLTMCVRMVNGAHTVVGLNICLY